MPTYTEDLVFLESNISLYETLLLYPFAEPWIFIAGRRLGTFTSL